MTTIADLDAWLERFAPTALAEPWDNVGLLIGDPEAPCRRVMTCLTVTPDSADEAVAERADMIVSHHPVLFKPTKTLRADHPETAHLWRLARAGAAIYSPHTALDNAEHGINAGLARRLGLIDVGPLRPTPPASLHKVVVFGPRTDREPVLAAAFAAGAGKIGAYGECSYSSPGVGTFFGDDSTHPAVGEPGRRESVREWRVEVLCPARRLPAVLDAIRSAHSYEEPAIDVYSIHPARSGPGIGRLGRLPNPEPLGALAERIADALPAPGLQFVGDPARPVTRVAIACGAGDEFLPDAARAGADVLLTGEARFHRALEAESLGLALILAGHYATERPGVEDLADALAPAFPDLRVWPSRAERDPLRAVGQGQAG
jgi:dinuclear metal center YbgI/SA1388 family protein